MQDRCNQDRRDRVTGSLDDSPLTDDFNVGTACTKHALVTLAKFCNLHFCACTKHASFLSLSTRGLLYTGVSIQNDDVTLSTLLRRQFTQVRRVHTLHTPPLPKGGITPRRSTQVAAAQYSRLRRSTPPWRTRRRGASRCRPSR